MRMPGVRKVNPEKSEKKIPLYQQLTTKMPSDFSEEEMALASTPLLAAARKNKEYEKEQRKEDLQERLAALNNLMRDGSGRDWKNQVKLVCEYLSAKGFLMFEIWIIIFAFFYSDVILDYVMMKTFYNYGDYKFMASTLFGIAVGIFFTLMELVNVNADDETPTWVFLMCGFLLPFQLHVAFLCGYSTYCGRVHHMIYKSKFAESVIEATMSAAVQTYAVIFRDYDAWDVTINFCSVTLSYMSIAYALTNFDLRREGLQGLPGISNGWTFKLCLVFSFRTCEIISRLTSWGLFQLSVRNEEVYQSWGFGIYGVVAVVAVDAVIMFVIQLIYQIRARRSGQLVMFLPSIIAWTNPMLLKSNAFTMPSSVYYAVRLLEILAMCAIAWKVEVFHGGHGRLEAFDNDPGNNLKGYNGFRAEFHNDGIVIVASAISTLSMFVLLPIIRYGFSDHVMLLDRAMFLNHTFSAVEDGLCENLLNWERNSVKRSHTIKDQCKRFHAIAGGLIADSSARLAAALHRPRMRRGSFVEADEEGDQTHATRRSSTELVLTPAPNDVDAEYCIDMERWLMEEYKQVAEVEAERHAPGHLFVESVYAGHNLHKWLKAADDFRIPESECSDCSNFQGRGFYREYLMIINESLRNHDVKMKLEDLAFCRTLLRVVPEWRQLHVQFREDVETELLLIEEKCTMIARLMQNCWPLHLRRFLPLARAFNHAFDAMPEVKLGWYVPDASKCGTPADFDLNQAYTNVKHQKTGEDSHDWIMRLQMHALVEMYGAVPKDYKTDEDVMKHPIFGLFKKDVELQAIADGAHIIQKLRDVPVVGTLTSTNDLTEQEALKLLLTWTKANLTLQVPWDKRWVLNKMLGVLTTAHEVLRLERITKTAKKHEDGYIGQSIDGAPEEIVVSKLEEVKGYFKTKGADGSYDFDFNKVQFTFTFVRAKELEAQTIPRLKNSWPVNMTGMLLLVSQMPEEDIQFLCGEESHDVTSKLRDCRECVENDAISALDDQYERLEKLAVNNVDPNTAVGDMDMYRKKKEKNGGVPDAQGIKDGKASSQSAMIEYEEINDKLHEHLRSLKEDPKKFAWSRKVIEHCGTIEEKLRKSLRKFRKAKDDFWNKEDGLLQQTEKKKRVEAEKEAEEQEKRAQEASQIADAIEDKAKQDTIEAEEKVKKAEEEKTLARELLRAANITRQEAEDQKASALKEREMADKRAAEATAQKLMAMKQVSKAKADKVKLEEQKLAIQEKYRDVMDAYNTAKQDTKNDVSWFEPFLKQLSEAVDLEVVGKSTSIKSSSSARSAPGSASASPASVRKAASSSSIH